MRMPIVCCLATLLGACATAPAADSSGAGTAAAGMAAAGTVVQVPSIRRPDGETAQWWFRDGAAQAAARGAGSSNAKNVIVFLGDGMSLTTVAAARIFEGQRNGGSGEENRLSWEEFPATAFSKTYNTDSQTPDSAGTMSAIATGVKTRAGVLSIGQSAKRGDCTGALAAPILTLWELADAAGMDAGVVTTTRVTHATPGATFTHSADRNWENDTDLPEAAKQAGCIDIARQLVETPFADNFDVLMGGGRKNFMPTSQRDPEYDDKVGERLDGRDLIAQWKQRHPSGVYVWNRQQLEAAPDNVPLLGLFEPDHMQYEHDRSRDGAGEPSLAEMTRAAITRLQRNPKGYVLLVEGGRIDHANHAGNAYRALSDTVAMSDAVRAAAQMTSDQDTLIVVTADHAHTLTFAGYPQRGNGILDKVRGGSGEESNGGLALDATGLPYTTIGYANGPGYTGATSTQKAGPKTFPHTASGYESADGRPDLTHVDTTAPDYMQESILPLSSETHGGEDVGIWARGPGSNAVRGSLEQNAIFHILTQATPSLRARLCASGSCANGRIPVDLPERAAFVPAAAQ